MKISEEGQIYTKNGSVCGKISVPPAEAALSLQFSVLSLQAFSTDSEFVLFQRPTENCKV
jgi:hypothetical protein